MNISILWASWQTGLYLIDQALSRWHKLTALVRHPEKLLSYKDKINIVAGSATNIDSVKKAIITSDIVIHCVSVPFFHPKPTSLFSQVTSCVIAARPRTPAKRFIVMSSFGTHHWRKLPRPANRAYEMLLGDVANDKEKEEDLLEACNLPWTIVKAVLLDKWTLSTYKITAFEKFQPSIRKFISRSTVANAILDIAESENYIKEKIVVEKA